jgi:hypothetical protein
VPSAALLNYYHERLPNFESQGVNHFTCKPVLMAQKYTVMKSIPKFPCTIIYLKHKNNTAFFGTRAQQLMRSMRSMRSGFMKARNAHPHKTVK